MNLNELLTKEIPNMKQSHKQVTDIPFNKNLKHTGDGYQTIAFLHKKYPNKVIKIIQMDDNTNAAYQFLRLCIKHQNNPYFPKIYNFKLYKNTIDNEDRELKVNTYYNDDFTNYDKYISPPDQQKYVLYVVTERLFKIPYSEFDKICMKLFNISAYDMRGYYRNPKHRKELYNKLHDKKLKEAFKLLEPLFNHYDIDIMSTGNLLKRENGQLVINDPVADK